MTAARRKAIPLGVKLQVALARFGLKLSDVEFDHQPQLAFRSWCEECQDTIPAANNPAFIRMLTVAEHDAKTNGPGGEKRITSAGSDAHARAKHRRLTGKNKPKVKKNWPSRPLQSRGFEKRRPTPSSSRSGREQH